MANDMVVGGDSCDEHSSFQDLYVHHGMWKAATRLSNELKDRVGALLKRHTDYSLVVTGHSLGAGKKIL